MKWLATVVPPVIVLIVIAVAAEFVLKWRDVPTYLLPRPSAVWTAASDWHEELLHALWQTAKATLIGFGCSAVIGVLLAIALASSRWVSRAFWPYTVFFQTVPIVAIAPMLVFWFGPGLRSVATCTFIVSIFPVITNTLAGLMSTDPALRDLFRLYRASPLQRLLKLRLPWALPSILVGLRIAAGLSVIGAIVGEFAAADLSEPGLGFWIADWARNGNTAGVFAAILMASLLGVAMLGALQLVATIALRRRA